MFWCGWHWAPADAFAAAVAASCVLFSWQQELLLLLLLLLLVLLVLLMWLRPVPLSARWQQHWTAEGSGACWHCCWQPWWSCVYI
jgi:hypothetical protein